MSSKKNSLPTQFYSNELRPALTSFLGEQLSKGLERIQEEIEEEARGPQYPPLNAWLKETTPRWNWDWEYQLYVQSFLDKVTRKEINKLIIQLPVRHGKSQLCTLRYPVYRLEYAKNYNVVCTSHTSTLSETFGRRAKRIAEIRGIQLSDERAAVNDWETASGCRYRSVGVGGAIIGDGFDLLIVDDPHKSREEAESETQRENVWEWFTQDLYGRQEPGAAIIVIMSRWHEDDLVGRIQSEFPGEWAVCDLPALAEENDPLGREPGQALCPERYNEEALADRKRVHGEYHFLGQYQQRPTAKEGIFFKVSNLEIVDAVPAGMKEIRAWDVAASEGQGDFTSGVRMGTLNGIFYVVDVKKGQWGTDTRDKNIRQIAEIDGHMVAVHGPQDPGAAGKDMALAFTRLLAGFSVKTERMSGKKDVRADPFSSQVNAGNVKLLKADWNKDYIEELRQFPLGKYDDSVDASSDAFNFLAKYQPPVSAEPSTTSVKQPEVPSSQTAGIASARMVDGAVIFTPPKPAPRLLTLSGNFYGR